MNSRKFRIFSTLSALAFMVTSLGCSQATESSKSTLVLKMPDHLEKSSGVSAFTSKACFAVNISHEKISSQQAGECDPKYGKFAGLIAPGGTLELEMDRGNGYSIDLYYVVSNQGCPKLDSSQGLGKLFGSNNVYRVAHQEALDFNQSQVTVELHLSWPNPSNSLANLHSLPASCKKDSTPISKMALREAGLVMGAGHGLTSGNQFIRVRIKDQNLETQSSGWGTKVLPARLGDNQ